MDVAAKLDEFGRPAWIAVMVLGFIIFWPIGLAILAYILWSGRMGCWKRGAMNEMRKARGRWHAPRSAGRDWGSSGNSAFDEYRAETLRRLEEEEQEFREFLDRLRQAKDKAEFDQFMAERRRGPRSDGPAPQPQE
jgi:hypothetical protein